jgi:hypothetical protein
VILIQALMRNVGTCCPDGKGRIQVGKPHKDASTDAGQRGGVARSSEETSESGWSEGATLSSYGYRSTGDGRNLWA